MPSLLDIDHPCARKLVIEAPNVVEICTYIVSQATKFMSFSFELKSVVCFKFYCYACDRMMCVSSLDKLGWTNKDKNNSSCLKEDIKRRGRQEMFLVLLSSLGNTDLLI